MLEGHLWNLNCTRSSKHVECRSERRYATHIATAPWDKSHGYRHGTRYASKTFRRIQGHIHELQSIIISGAAEAKGLKVLRELLQGGSEFGSVKIRDGLGQTEQAIQLC